MSGHTPGPWVADGITVVALDSTNKPSKPIVTPYPDTTVPASLSMGRMRGNARLIAASTIIPDLYASEINAKIEWFWDGGFDVAIGDDLNGWRANATVDSWIDALEWLAQAACNLWPESDFAVAREAAALARKEGVSHG